MEDEISKNNSGQYARITLYPGCMKVREWKTRSLNPALGKYAVTAAPDHRLVLLPRDGGMMRYLDSFSNSIRISRANTDSERYVMTFERGLLIKGPRIELD